MRAAVLRQYNADLVIEDVPDTACPTDGVVLRVMACGISGPTGMVGWANTPA